MDFRDFLFLADSLAKGTTEAEWRSACSRGYYAAFAVEVRRAGSRLSDLRRERNRADYDDRRTITQATANQNMRFAEEVIQVLDAAAVEPVRTQITDAMKVYERDVLHDLTWHP